MRVSTKDLITGFLEMSVFLASIVVLFVGWKIGDGISFVDVFVGIFILIHYKKCFISRSDRVFGNVIDNDQSLSFDDQPIKIRR
jgi:hypothetical protein